MRRLLLAVVLLVGATALIAGCGGSDSGSGSKSATDWASGYCTASNAWVTTLAQQLAAAQTGSTSASDAAQTVTSETNDFTQSIDGLGAPDTPDGSTSETTAKDLSTKLQGRVARISAAASTNNPDVTAAQQRKIVGDQISASLTDVSATTTKLETEDAELGTAMQADADCTKLKTALSAVG